MLQGDDQFCDTFSNPRRLGVPFQIRQALVENKADLNVQDHRGAACLHLGAPGELRLQSPGFEEFIRQCPFNQFPVWLNQSGSTSRDEASTRSSKQETHIFIRDGGRYQDSCTQPTQSQVG